MSRFESNLLESIKSAVNETRRTVLQLAWAAYKVRIGDSIAARRIVDDVRLRYANQYTAQVFARVNFVEGLCEFFDGGIESAMPKLKRSNALSIGCPIDDDLPILIRAWLAGLYRNLGKWDLMVDFLISAASCRWRMSDEASSRLCLVAADAFQEIESYAVAARWYTSAHHHALVSGDDSALSAILYNRAAIRIFNARLGEIDVEQVDINDSRIALEAASAKNYTQYIKDGSMRWGFDLMTGQLLILRRDYESAIAFLDSVEVHDLENQWPAVDLIRRSDVFRCRAMLRLLDVEELRSLADQIWTRSSEISGAGDRAISAHSLSVGLKGFDLEASNFFRAAAQDALVIFNMERQREAVELDRFVREIGNSINSVRSMIST